MEGSCSTSNASALKTLVSHAGESSAMPFGGRVEGPSGSKHIQVGRTAQNNSTNGFFAQGLAQQPPTFAQNNWNNAFDLNQMRNDLPPQSILQQQQRQPSDFDHFTLFDDAFSRARSKDVVPMQKPNNVLQSQFHNQSPQSFLPRTAFLQQQQRTFTRQTVVNSAVLNSATATIQMFNPQDAAAFDEAFAEATAHANASSTFLDNASKLTPQEDSLPQVDIVGPDSASLLAQTAAHLIQTVDTTAGATDPKFANSKFMQFMKHIRDGELGIENNKVVEMKNGVSSSGVANQPILSVSDDWVKEVGGMQGSSGYYGFDGDEDPLYSGYGLSAEQQKPLNWASDYLSSSRQQEDQTPVNDGDLNVMEEEENAFAEFYNETGTGPSSAARLGQLNTAVMESSAKEWEDLEMSWNSMYAGNRPHREVDATTAMRNFMEESDIQDSYDFIPSNPYLRHPLDRLKNVAMHENLSESILSLEAAVQNDPMDATSWKNLGLRQQENENEVAAIAALRKAIALDPTLLDSWIALAVSYTNDSLYSEAYKALEGWIEHSGRYSHLLTQQERGNSQHEFLTNLYISAARSSSENSSMDAGVQMALGVLFNISGEHEKALDCFRACLSLHPQDYMLWNKVGATLANSKDAATALEAYKRALQLNPDFLRARYNVAIAFLQLGRYREAAEHLVSILEAQERNVAGIVAEDQGKGKNVAQSGSYEERLWQLHSLSSGSTWNTLWMVMDRYLNRPDLAKEADNKNLDAFRTLDF